MFKLKKLSLLLLVFSFVVAGAAIPTRFTEVVVREGLTVTGTSTLTGAVTQSGDGTYTSSTTLKPEVNVVNTNADATAGNIDLQKDSASPAANDVLGNIRYQGDDAGGNVTNFVTIVGKGKDPSSGTEDGLLEVDVFQAGTAKEVLSANDAEVRLNGDSADIDFVVESDSLDPAFSVDGGTGITAVAGTLTIATTANIGGAVSDRQLTIKGVNSETLTGIKINRGTDDVNQELSLYSGGGATYLENEKSTVTSVNVHVMLVTMKGSDGRIESARFGPTHILLNVIPAIAPLAVTPSVGIVDGMMFYNTANDNMWARVNGAWVSVSD